ncbi:MAG: Gfo/Idh/MocA family oxidoreductase, partial [Bacteroidota bacterium]
MVQVLLQVEGVEVVAVGSRSIDKAQDFARKWNIPRFYDSYEGVAQDDSVSIVYIATPSLRHPEDCRMALENSKAVLCEKTMAPNSVIATQILQTAESKGCFFLHGVWSRFFPAMTKIRELLESGEIGEIRSARASFCQNDGAGSCSALLETGIYCAQFLQWVLGDPNGEAPIVRGAAGSFAESSGH